MDETYTGNDGKEMKCIVLDCNNEVIDDKKGWKKYCCINHRRVPPLSWNCVIEGCTNKIYSENMRKRYCKEHVKTGSRIKGNSYYHRIIVPRRLESKRKSNVLCRMCLKPIPIEKHSWLFCSLRCVYTWHRRKSNIEKMLSREKIYKNCMTCKKPFLVKSIIHKFCSPECTRTAYYMTKKKEVLLC